MIGVTVPEGTLEPGVDGRRETDSWEECIPQQELIFEEVDRAEAGEMGLQSGFISTTLKKSRKEN